MRFALFLSGVFATVLAAPLAASAQMELIVYEKPFHSRHLAGIVADSTGAPLPDVKVELCARPAGDGKTPREIALTGNCGEDPTKVLGSATTDANGHFSFLRSITKRKNLLHLSLPGFDPILLLVDVHGSAPSELRITMKPAA